MGSQAYPLVKHEFIEEIVLVSAYGDLLAARSDQAGDKIDSQITVIVWWTLGDRAFLPLSAQIGPMRNRSSSGLNGLVM